jgi:hypothetical protein
MTVSTVGPVSWGLDLTEEGHRDYKLKWHCRATDAADGPANVLIASGLPAVGSTWNIGNDTDSWAFCWPNWKISQILDGELNLDWIVEQPFSTRPMKRCQTSTIEDPMDEPPKISGSFVTYTTEATADYLGNPLVSSSWEQLRGPLVERDACRATVNIGINVATLPLSSYTQMMNTVNDATLWGLPPRCVKLSGVEFQRNLYGTCSYYYTITYRFDIDFNTFDVYVLDEGSRVLAGAGTSSNPLHFIAYRDFTGERSRVILDGSGNAWNGTGSPGTRLNQKYAESNLLLLDIPASL